MAGSAGSRVWPLAPPRRRRASGATAAGLALVLALLGAGAARAQEVPASAAGAPIASVSFEGAHALRPAVLRAAIETVATTCTRMLACPFGIGAERQRLDLERLRADVLRLRLFYYRHGYRQARVEVSTTPAGKGLRVVFHIEEGRPVRVGSLQVTGADSIVPRGVLQNLPLHPGDPFGTISYEATRDTLTARLSNRGYAHVQVLAGYDLPLTDTLRLASVRYQLIPGPLTRFDSIQVLGAHKIAPVIIRRMLTFRKGNVYSPNEVVRSQRNLFGLGVFRHVDIRPDLGTDGDSLVPVTVNVTEGDIHSVRLGVGLNTAEAVNAEATWTSRDFVGGARHLELRGKVSNVLASALEGLPFMETTSSQYTLLNGSLSADFQQPWFFDPLNTFGAGVFAQRQSFPNVFVQTSEGAYFTLNRNLGGGATVALGYRPELSKLTTDDERIFCENLVVCDQTDITVLSQPHWLAPLTVSFSRDHSNAFFAPTNGSIFRFDGEFASQSTGSAFAYWRAMADLSEYRELLPGIVLALRIHPGMARSLAEPSAGHGLGLHPQKRFFAGGANSVRGFAQYQLGPKVLTLDASRFLLPDSTASFPGCSITAIEDGSCDASALPQSDFEVRPTGGAALFEGSVELRFPLGISKLRGAAFVDYGQLWSTPADVRLRDLVFTPGFGVRYFSAIGPIRVDVGYDPQGPESLTVYTTDYGARLPNGTLVCGRIPNKAAGESAVNCGSLYAITPRSWPIRTSFWDHLQLHFSIGQAF